MHSSAISLLYRAQERKHAVDTSSAVSASASGAMGGAELVSPEKEINSGGAGNNYLVNLVDSPGHIDFSSDVSTATRLCDGAMIIIDVVEGICTQTHAVLYKALKERMTPCLILNKIDRFALELQQTPLEAYHHIRRIIENVNALSFTLLTSESIISEQKREELSQSGLDGKRVDASGRTDGEAIGVSESLLDQWTFSPERGNVIFCCAVDCWAFGTLKFANIWAKKLGLNNRVLNRYMFEEYYLNPSTKKIVKCDPDDSSNVPMFVSLILEPIWKLYAAAVTDRDPEKAARMANRGMGITLTPREINLKDPRSTLQTIFQKWLPLPEALLRMVVRCIPDPSFSQRSKFDTLFSCDNEEELEISSNDSLVKRRAISTYQECKDSVRNCVVSAPSGSGNDGSHSVPTVVFISKMTPVKLIDLSPVDASNIRAQRRQEFLDAGGSVEDVSKDPDRFEGDLLMALGRVFSGRLDSSQLYYALSHRHNAVDMVSHSDAFESGDIALPSTVSVVKPGSIGLYLCFGPSFKSVSHMPAGNIVGIIGLDSHILKTGTLCSSFYCPPMRAITFQAKPILRVAIEPTRHQDLASVVNGLKGLYQFDPVVEVAVESSGQYTISCLGELHLELCLKALKERFAK